MITLVVAGWHYASPDMKQKLLAAVGIAARGNGAEVKHIIADVILPKDPAARRAALARELEKNIAEMKRRIEASKNEEAILGPAGDAAVVSSGTDGPDAKIRVASAADLVSASEGIVKEIESANKDVSLGSRVLERVLDAVLPARGAQCPAK